MGAARSLTLPEHAESAVRATESRVTGTLTGKVTGTLTGKSAVTGKTAGKRITGTALLGMVVAAVEQSPKSKGVIAVEMGVKPPRLTGLLTGERPWTLDRVATLPDDVRCAFLQRWIEAEGMPASVASALRSLADAMDTQGRLPLIGEAGRRHEI